jgi:exportin-1
MAKPEEVIIVEDENGDIVREMTKDTEVIAQYKTMREALVFLTNLNYEDTEHIMLSKLATQVERGGFTWTGLNTLCWAVGSISGAMGESDEKKFLVTVIKDLLKLCEDQRGKENKAIVASNIMYIVGNYPRFLRAHWKFLKTVVNKLFEFMHEPHPGVQDMACDTFLKIAQKCKRKFTTPQSGVQMSGASSPSLTNVLDTQPYLLTLISQLPTHIRDLQSHQILSFYESVATMLSDKGPQVKVNREEAMLRLMDMCNSTWMQMMAGGEAQVVTLECVREVARIIKTNAVVCTAAGSGVYVHQLSSIFADMMRLYRLYSIKVREACASQGDIAARTTVFKAMRGAKSEVVELLTAFIAGSSDIDGGGEHIAMQTFMTRIMQELFEDYRLSPAAARDAKVLSFFASSATALKDLLTPLIPAIVEAILDPTLSMITTNMLDYPEHRTCFFRFIREANQFCFQGLFVPVHQTLIVNSIIWAFKHTERNISEMGLEVLNELLLKLSHTSDEVAQPFYQQYLLILIQDVLGLMTDRLHKSGFKLQSTALRQMFQGVLTGQVKVPLFEVGSDNLMAMKNHVASLLLNAFPNLTQQQVVSFVIGIFDGGMDLAKFKDHMRDFLIRIKVNKRILFKYS